MTLSLRMVALFLLAACIRLAAAPIAIPRFEFDARFEPAFHSPSRLTIRSTGQAAKLMIRISDVSVSVPLDDAVAIAFLREATQNKPTPAKKEQGMDGCDVKLRLTVDAKRVFSSDVWSPTKESTPTEYALLQALYKVADQSHVSSPQAEYLEHLFGYFEGIQPRWKVVSGNPGTVRFYARLSSDDIPAFRALIVSLPADRETVFDITNLESTGTLFYDEFLKATAQRPIKWRAGKGWSEQLIKIGIAKDRIIPPKA